MILTRSIGKEAERGGYICHAAETVITTRRQSLATDYRVMSTRSPTKPDHGMVVLLRQYVLLTARPNATFD